MTTTISTLAEAINDALAPVLAENEALKEGLHDVQAQLALEDRGWEKLLGGSSGDDEGLTLRELKEMSASIRPMLTGDSLVRRGCSIHTGYVWSKGMNIAGVERKRKAGAPSRLVQFYENRTNRDSLFGPSAHAELQKARFADGVVLMACYTRDGTVRRIPISQITDIKVNPDFPEEIWAYKREWGTGGGAGAKKSQWLYTYRYTGPRQKSFSEPGGKAPVAQDVTIVDRHYNRQIGWSLGVPDSVAMIPWSAAYTEVVQHGRIVTEALAKILYKITSQTKNGQSQVGVKMSSVDGVGNAANMTDGQDVQAVSTAGKGYDFVSARPIAAMAASAIDVSVVELLSDSSAAGSSYGAAQTLTPSVKNAMRSMQDQWTGLYTDILDQFGLKSDRIWFDDLEEYDLYRQAQALTLLSPALGDEEYRGEALALLGIAGDASAIPPTLAARLEITAAAQAASPDQGRSNPAGEVDSGEKNDLE